MMVKTIADVRMLPRHLPEDRHEWHTWRHVAAELEQAAAGAGDTVNVAVALRMVLMLENVECRPA